MKSSLKIISLAVLSLLLIGLSLSVALSAGPPVVTPGADPSAVLLGAVRYREMATGNDAELFLGIPDLGDGTHRTQTDLTWGGGKPVSFTYDPLLDQLTTTVGSGTPSWTLVYPNYSDNLRDLIFAGSQALADEALGKLNYLQIDIRLQEGTPAQVSLDDVSLDGNPLGSFAGVNHQTSSWQVNGYDLRSGFTLTGTINLVNVTSPSAELNKIDISFGYVDADTFAPTVSSVSANPNPGSGGESVTLTATADDTASGGSIIQSAYYRLGTGEWTAMAAADGSFDSPAEELIAALVSPTSAEDHNLCVHATDSAGNTSPDQCITLKIDNQGPLTSAVTLDPLKVGGSSSVSLSALVDDATTGGSNVQSAEFSTNGEDWSPMTAQDGSFDSPSETVTTDFLSPDSHGSAEVCVRGTDVAGNTGPQACASLTVDNQGPEALIQDLMPNPADPGALVTLTATLDDTSTGNSNITSAEYQLSGGSWSIMEAVDGNFDAVLEQVTIQFQAPLGSASVEVCVRGDDQYGNTGPAECVEMLIYMPDSPPFVYLPFLVSNFSPP